MTAFNLLRCLAWGSAAVWLSAAPALAGDDASRDAARAEKAARAAEAARERAEAASAQRDRDEVRRGRGHDTAAAPPRPAPVDMTVDPFNGGPPTPVANCYDSPRGCPAPAPKN